MYKKKCENILNKKQETYRIMKGKKITTKS